MGEDWAPSSKPTKWSPLYWNTTYRIFQLWIHQCIDIEISVSQQRRIIYIDFMNWVLFENRKKKPFIYRDSKNSVPYDFFFFRLRRNNNFKEYKRQMSILEIWPSIFIVLKSASSITPTNFRLVGTCMCIALKHFALVDEILLGNTRKAGFRRKNYLKWNLRLGPSFIVQIFVIHNLKMMWAKSSSYIWISFSSSWDNNLFFIFIIKLIYASVELQVKLQVLNKSSMKNLENNFFKLYH